MSAPFWLPTDAAPGEDVAPADGNAYNPAVKIYPWDKITLNGEELPGLCKLIVPMISIRLDDHKQPGFSLSPFVPLGLPPATLDLDWRLVTPEDWRSAQAWIALLWGNPTKKFRGAGQLQKTKQLTKTQAADVVPVWEIGHPMLEGTQINKVAVVGYQPPQDAPDSPQAKLIKLRFRQWAPAPKKAPSKPRPVEKPTAQPFQFNPSNQAGPPPSANPSELKRK